jgi:hypothetical protein
MSNRGRRQWLRGRQLQALAAARERAPENIGSIEDWNRWKRIAFKSLKPYWREPLSSPNNVRPDSGQ